MRVLTARIAFVSPTGWGNLGDAAIIDSLIHGVRARLPGATIVGFTQNPHDTRVRHRIDAFTLGGLTVPRYKIVEGPPRAAADAGGGTADRQTGASAARKALAMVPGLRGTYRLLRQVDSERRHRRLSAERIRHFDVVVVSGGGQLDEFWGGPFGHPYTLWRWGQLARAEGARYLVLSVGTGTLHRLGKLFVRRALALAEYRSYRDARSRELIGAPELTSGDPVVPDLAYAVPLAPAPPAAPRPSAIGVSPLAYVDPSLAPVVERRRYERHIAGLAGLTVRLVRAGHDVVLFSSDSQDRKPLAELRAQADAELAPDQRARIRVPEVDAVGSLLSVLRGCAVVVAARLHGVLLGHVAGRPALAISYERKVRTLMEGMGHERFCFELEEFDADGGWQRFRELHARADELAAEVARTVGEYRQRVDAQYDRVFGAPP